MADGPHTHAHSATMLAPYVVCEPLLFVISAMGGRWRPTAGRRLLSTAFRRLVHVFFRNYSSDVSLPPSKRCSRSPRGWLIARCHANYPDRAVGLISQFWNFWKTVVRFINSASLEVHAQHAAPRQRRRKQSSRNYDDYVLSTAG